jgi:hypothetical protein
MRLLQFLALLLVGRRLGIVVVILFPLTKALMRRSSRGTVLSLTSRGFSSSESRSWRWSTASNATPGSRVRVMLIWALVSIAARGPCSILHDGSNLWWRAATHATIRGERTLAGRSVETGRRRWRWRRHISSMRTVVRV